MCTLNSSEITSKFASSKYLSLLAFKDAFVCVWSPSMQNFKVLALDLAKSKANDSSIEAAILLFHIIHNYDTYVTFILVYFVLFPRAITTNNFAS